MRRVLRSTTRIGSITTSMVRWASRRAWSRAGAVAEIVAKRPVRRALGLAGSVGLMVGGSVVVAAAVSLLFWTDLGPGPLDVFASALHTRLGISLAAALWSLSAMLIVTATLLGRRPGPGTLLAPFLVGGLVDVFVGLTDEIDRPTSLVVRAAVHLGAVGIVGLGAGLLISSGLGAGTGELLAAATSDRTGRSEPGVRLAFEASWVVLGVALGGPIGLGTAIVMLAIGPAVAQGHAAVERSLGASRRAAGRVGRDLLAAR